MSDLLKLQICNLCEAPSTGRFCEGCLGQAQPPITVDPAPRGALPTLPPDKQLPTIVDSLEPIRDEVKKIEVWLDKIILGETPPPPKAPRPSGKDPEMERYTVPLKKPIVDVGDSFRYYGRRVPGIRGTDDVNDRHHLLLVDPHVLTWDVEMELLTQRSVLLPDSLTYVALVNIQVVMYGNPTNLPPFYLLDEESRTFITADEESPIKYSATDVPRLARLLWRAGLQMQPVLGVSGLLDFHLFVLHGPFKPEPPLSTCLYDRKNYTQSRHLLHCVVMRPGEKLCSLGGFPAFFDEAVVTDPGENLALFLGWGMVVLPAHRDHKPDYPTYLTMDPTSKAQLGRCYWDGATNTFVANPLIEAPTAMTIVRVDDGPPTLVKLSGPVSSVVFEHSPMGPLFFSGPVTPTRPDDVFRCAVSYIEVDNRRLTVVGKTLLVAYNELDGGPYLRSPRVINHLGGTLIKIPLSPEGEDPRSFNELEDKAIELARKINLGPLEPVEGRHLIFSTTSENLKVASLYYELRYTDDDIAETFAGVVSLEEVLTMPTEVSLNPQTTFAKLSQLQIEQLTSTSQWGLGLSSLI